MSSFFLNKKPRRDGLVEANGAGKRRRKPNEREGKPQKKAVSQLNEEISSDSDTERPVGQKRTQRHIEDEEIEETAQEKKLRLAKSYLAQLQQQEEEKAEEETFQQDLVAGRLEEEVLEQRGKLQRLVAKDLQPPDATEIRMLKGHKGPITCLVISPDDQHIFSASKDCSIIKWDVCSGKKVHVIPRGRKGIADQHGHMAHILAMAISSDGKYLATGDKNKLILIWAAETCSHLYKFPGHRDAVSALSFRKGTYQLYSASHDRSLKVWNVAENAYVETLFGHQDVVTGLDSLSRERCVTAGGRDGTVRVWKIAEESQLVFHGHDGSIDCVQLINEEHMVSGADDGSVALWSVSKKKPLATVKQAHGIHGALGLQQPCWISSVSAMLNSDVVATGSHDSSIRLWHCGEGFRSLKALFDVPLIGFVNSLKFSSTGDFLVAGVGQEHRLGRWWCIKEAKNAVYIVPLKRTPAKQGSE
ncbi:U3 small nucleolar RNA-interacting protein 2 [Rhinatrema bivittatum]|uniref:U3 small nucleolar RNA-interacting protein 2 n=1 Tax=Rhinatrema bivittatum TaxID=194408 RepID=UPI00112D16BB|nr:U3 small nucleolar RNA-interacting protein 2 [Rhinatrema bivittatum]